MDLDSLLTSCEKNYNDDNDVTYADSIVNDVEKEFKGYKSIKAIRKDEKIQLLQSLELNQDKLKKINRANAKRIGNSSKRDKFLQDIKEKKRKIQNKINNIKLKLEDLKIESEETLLDCDDKTEFTNYTPYGQDGF